MTIDEIKDWIARGQRATRAVNDLVVLIEGRGFWRTYRPDALTWNPDGTVRPKAACWAGMRFVAVVADRLTFVCAQPAIGPANGLVDEHYRPGGWHRPDEARDAGAADAVTL